MALKIITSILSTLVFCLLFVGFASAGVLELSALSYSPTASHDSDVTVNFNVTYSGSLASTTLDFGDSSSNIGQWTNLPSSIAVANNSIPVQLSAVLSIPKHAAGVVSAQLEVDSIETVAEDNELLTITLSNSPSLDITSTQALTDSQSGKINVTNTGNTNLNNIALSYSGDFNVSFSSNNFALGAGNSLVVDVDALEDLSDFGLGDYDVQIRAQDTTTSASDTYAYTVPGVFCEYGNVNASKIDITELQDESSGDEWEWKPLDQIEIEVEIENNLDDDEDFVVELALYDTEDNDFVELDGENTLEEDISIDEDDSEKVTFEFEVPIEVEDSKGRYVLYVKAYVDGDEELYCNSYTGKDVPNSDVQSIEITKEKHDVVISDISAPEVVQAGDIVIISGRAFNIGSEDQDKVKINLVNTKLDLDIDSDSFELETEESEAFEFSFVVPYTAENGAYTFKMRAYFDYSKSSDFYEESSDSFSVSVDVAGGEETTEDTASITASLESDARAGEDMEISVTLANLGDERTTYIVSATNYDSWATLNSISERIITLDSGDSEDITVTLNVNEDVSGEQTFTIEARAGDSVDAKEIAVVIEDGSFFSTLTDSFESSTLLWIIGIINMILVILIIILAVKIFR